MKLGTIGSVETIEPKGDVYDVRIPTLESIAYQQNDSFGPDIEALCLRFMEKVKAGATSAQVDKEYALKEAFNKLVRSRIGVNAILYCDGLSAATFPNVYVDHSPIVREATRNYLSYDQGGKGAIKLKIQESGKNLGSVDPVKVKLTGWLSEQEVALYINFNALMAEADYSSAEITAIILHELGHDFEGAAMCARAVSTNLILSDVARHITDDRSGRQEYIYRELTKLDPELSKDTVAGLMNGNPVVMGVAAFRLAQGTFRNLSGSRLYSDTSYEALSDSFATRFGYGAALATGFQKTSERYELFNIAKEVTATVIAIAVSWGLISLFASLMAGVWSLGVLGGIVMQGLTFRAIVRSNRTTNQDNVYDDDFDRIARVKRDLVNGLKSAKISSSEKKALLEQLQTVDKALEKSYNMPAPIRKLLNLVFVSDGRSQKSIEAQKQLEALVANDIFISASKLEQKSA